MSTAVFLEQLLNGLGIGLAYALIALGYNLTFGVLNVANLAYGEIFMAGALGAFVAAGIVGFPPALAVAAGVLCATLAGLGVHAIAIAPLGRIEQPNSPRHVAVLVSTIGASLVIQYSVVALFGSYPQPFPNIVPRFGYSMGGVTVSSTLLLNSIVAIGTFALLAATLMRTSFGLRLRALTANRDLGQAMGIRVSRDQALCVALSSAFAGLAGILVCHQIGLVSAFIGITYGLKGLVALIVGRSLLGTAAVATALGLAEALVAGYWSSSYRDLIVYALLIVFVVTRSRREAWV